jgi:dipeptidyl aminopeptidase/acylaminoacyl peptidase
MQGWHDDYDDLIAAVDHVVEAGDADPKRLAVTGDAYGGIMVNWIIGHTNRFAAAAARRSASNYHSFFGTSDRGGSGDSMLQHQGFGGADPYTNPDAYLKRSPISYAHNIKTPLLLSCSEGDMREPLGQSEELFVALKYLGKSAKLVVFPTSVHFLSRRGRPRHRAHFFRSIVEWFDRHIGSVA